MVQGISNEGNAMRQYIFKRLLLIIPTLLGIMILNFAITQAAPGGPVEQTLSQLRQETVGATSRIGGSTSETSNGSYRGRQGVEEELVEEIKKMYGFDKPVLERFWVMVKNYATFDFGDSFYQDRSVVSLMIDRMPVSISLGLWSTLLIYLISIPMGIMKAVKHGSTFDRATSAIVIVGYAVPSFLFAMLLIVLFAGGEYWQWFPLRGLVSENWESLSRTDQILDYFWHLVLPITALTIGGFAGLTLLTKNSFLEEISKQYTMTAKAKGNTPKRILWKHIFRNAMLIVVAGFPAAFIGILFTGALLIEVMFSLEGLGLLGYEAAITRDYPIVFGALYVFTLVGLLLNLINDLMYVWIDPRIDFDGR